MSAPPSPGLRRRGRTALRALVIVAVIVLAALVALALVPLQGKRAPAGEPPSPETLPSRAAEPPPPVLLARRLGELPAPVLRRARALAGVERVSVGYARRVGLRRSRTRTGRTVDRPPPGFAIPLELYAFEPRSYAPLLPPRARAAMRGLGRGEALLSETSARVRRLGRGARLELEEGRTLRVAEVLDDEVFRRAEIIVTDGEGRRLGAQRRLAFVPYEGDPEPLATELQEAGGRELRVRDLGRAPWPDSLRILDQATLKARFGEFAVRTDGGRAGAVSIDPAWRERNIVAERVPILGGVSCHREMIAPLRRALGELRRRGLERLVDPGDYAGCYAAKDIPTSGAVSRHAWGLAIDVNAAANPYGQPSTQDRRLVEVMKRNGFAWGGDWPTPDAMHFEYTGQASAATGEADG